MNRKIIFSICTHIIVLTVLVLLTVGVTACGGKKTLTTEEQIRSYLYENQPVSEKAFLRWADQSLEGTSSRRVYEALYNEAKFQAELGHATATGVLQNLAKAWAGAKGLRHDTAAWKNIQEEAINNLEKNPSMRSLWPSK